MHIHQPCSFKVWNCCSRRYWWPSEPFINPSPWIHALSTSMELSMRVIVGTTIVVSCWAFQVCVCRSHILVPARLFEEHQHDGSSRPVGDYLQETDRCCLRASRKVRVLLVVPWCRSSPEKDHPLTLGGSVQHSIYIYIYIILPYYVGLMFAPSVLSWFSSTGKIILSTWNTGFKGWMEAN